MHAFVVLGFVLPYQAKRLACVTSLNLDSINQTLVCWSVSVQAGFVMTLGMNGCVTLRNGSPWDGHQPACVEGEPHLPGVRNFCCTGLSMKVQC